MPLFELDDVSIAYHSKGSAVFAVNRVSLGLEAGGALGLVGESGCGKSTLALATLPLPPEEPGPGGGGSGTSRSASTSGPPNASQTTAFMAPSLFGCFGAHFLPLLYAQLFHHFPIRVSGEPVLVEE